jgi:A/G-specific adenine glycosylase
LVQYVSVGFMRLRAHATVAAMKPRARPLDRMRTRLLAWYAAGHRDLPWRRTRDAYRVWVSEIMLQQTRVETVVPYYERFLARFPDLATLARAPLDDVLAAWSGLGYYRRARHLHTAAATIVREHGGRFPRALDDARELPGIGRSTAGAIVSIAYDERAPILDGNVRRVLARLFLVRDAATRAAESRLWELSSELVDGDEPGELNQALMELGATTCLPFAGARCESCPLRADCAAYAEGRATVERLPEPPRSAAPRAQTWAVAIAERDGRWLVRRRGERGLMHGLYEFPTCELADGDAPEPRRRAALARWLEQELGVEARIGAERMTHRHAISNRVVTERVHEATVAAAGAGRARWLDADAIRALAITTATRRILERLERERADAPLFAAADAPALTSRAAASRRRARRP